MSKLFTIMGDNVGVNVGEFEGKTVGEGEGFIDGDALEGK